MKDINANERVLLCQHPHGLFTYVRLPIFSTSL